jgi:hypothetical protein
MNAICWSKRRMEVGIFHINIKNRNVCIPDSQFSGMGWHHVGKVKHWLVLVVLTVHLGSKNSGRQVAAMNLLHCGT